MRSYALRQPLGVGRSLIALAMAILLVGLLAVQAFAVSAGTVSIDAGATYTTDIMVDLTLANSDATAVQVAISNNGLDWHEEAWSPTAGTKTVPWDLTNATFGGYNTDGTKRVYVHWTDADGIASTKVSDLITLDRAVPTGSIYINANAVATQSSTVSLKLSGYDRSSGVAKVRVSNTGAGADGNLQAGTYTEYVYTTSMTVSGWALSPTTDGTRWVYAQYIDKAGHISKVYADSIKVDNGAPAGAAGMPQINRNAAYSKSHNVLVSVSALDPALADGTAGSGLAKVALSNDGVTYQTVNYTSAVSWNLVNATYGGTSTTGVKTVWVKWMDKAGNWSTVRSDTITYDPVAPTLPAGVSQSLYLNSTLGSTVPVKETWSAATDPVLGDTTAGSGIARYQVQQSINGGAWTTVAYPGATVTSLNRLVTPGGIYRFQVRAQDKAGNLSGWVQSDKFKALVYQEAATSITYTGTWTRQYLSTASGLYAKYTTSSAAGATFAYNGSDVALVAHKSSLRGTAGVKSVTGTTISDSATVNLYSSTTLPRRVVYAANFDANAARSVAVDVTKPRFDIDAFIVLQEVP